MGDYDAGDYILLVGESPEPIDEFSGIENWTREKDVSVNKGPGGVVHGWNHQRNGDHITFDLNVRQTSEDLGALRELRDSEKPVPIRAIVPQEKRDIYEVGQEIGLGCNRGVLADGGDTQLGSNSEAQDVSFSVEGKGPVTFEKSE